MPGAGGACLLPGCGAAPHIKKGGKKVIKIMPIADLHLDAPFAHCTPSERALRRDEQREALCRVCEICKSEKVDIMLISGDLFDGDFLRSDTPVR